jgi:hypothetical protein
MNRNFNINEILESIDEIVTNNKNKKFRNKNINIADNPEAEKIISDAEKTLKPKLKETPLILEKEFVENEDHENRDFTKNIIEVENNLKKLKNSYTYENKLLKSKNLKQEEELRDLNTLLKNFKEKDMYSDLYNKIELYQKDNAALRKKIFNLIKAETKLRLELSNISLNKQVDKKNNE